MNQFIEVRSLTPVPVTGVSSKGKTAASNSADQGSIPCSPAIFDIGIVVGASSRAMRGLIGGSWGCEKFADLPI